MRAGLEVDWRSAQVTRLLWLVSTQDGEHTRCCLDVRQQKQVTNTVLVLRVVLSCCALQSQPSEPG